ncbi:MAG: carboxypeptidase-like regulatory domain-containing protein [Proteobacteria bacterium]|nr:carboxypeptidase-like regulatory domain-containing protein [Pseudomonadota bacterium]MBU1738138.1 carboxypeptidase-like regulatory domain-containing protein [Pseudomonadota bacterium]
MTRITWIILLLFILTGCATQRIPFPETELSRITIKGDHTIQGEIFLIDQFEEKQVGIEQEVTLEPVSSYSDQWYTVSYLGNRSIKKADPRYEQYVARTQSDKEGKFSITGVAPGEYYLTGTVGWHAVNCSSEVVVTNVPISNKLTVDNTNRILEVKLTKPYNSPTLICDLYNQGDWDKN